MESAAILNMCRLRSGTVNYEATATVCGIPMKIRIREMAVWSEGPEPPAAIAPDGSTESASATSNAVFFTLN